MTDKISPTVQEAVQHIDAQIHHHLGLIQDLKSQRNDIMPISRLPAEILGKIFHEVRGNGGGGQDDDDDDDDSFYTPFSYSEPSLKWIYVSHVTRHWRNVAISDASLWTDPPLKNAQWTMIMLERSRIATIPAITLEVHELDKHVVAALMSHIPRVSSLVIPYMARRTLKWVLSRLPSAAPTLEALSISFLTKATGEGGIRYYRPTSRLLDEALAIPVDILRHTPKLQHLQLRNIIIAPDSPLLSRLTTFSMSGIREKSKPTPQQFKTMLESAPFLKRLDLKGVCPGSTGSNQQQEWTAPVLMQHLEYLDIDDTIPRLVYFFRILSATHLLKELTVNVDYTKESASDLPLLFAALDQPYLRSVIGSSTDVRRLVVSNYDGHPFIQASKLSISERNLDPDERRMSGYSTLMTMWIDTSSEGIEYEDLARLSETLPSDLYNNFTWTGLSELQLTALEDVSPQLIASTFGTIPQLRIIITDSDVAPLLIKALNHRPDAQSDSSGSTPFLFPGLQHMDLGRTSLTQGDGTFETLCRCLQQRHECGIPIISLKFEHVQLKKQVFLKLKKYVEHIILTPSEDEHKIGDDYSPYNYTWYL